MSTVRPLVYEGKTKRRKRNFEGPDVGFTSWRSNSYKLRIQGFRDDYLSVGEDEVLRARGLETSPALGMGRAVRRIVAGLGSQRNDCCE